MEIITTDPPPIISTNLAKPKFGNYFNARDIFWLAMIGVSALGAAGAALHVAGATEFLDPTLPLATDAELNPDNYPRFEDTEFPDRNKMMEVLSQRIDVKVVCTITTRSYGQVHVFADRPFWLPAGGQEIETGRNDTVLPRCIQLIQEQFNHGRARSVTYQMSIGNAWHGSSSEPTIGPFEQNDENGNGILHENIPLTLGNKWHVSDAVDRLEDAQEEYIDLKQALRDRDSSLANAWNRVQIWAENKINRISDSIIDHAKQKFWHSMPWGNNEAHPS